MPVTPTRNITFRRGDTYEHEINFQGINVAAWTFAAQIRRSPDDRSILASFVVDMTAAVTGFVALTLQEAVTAKLALEAVWDVQVVIAGDKFTIFGGDVTIERDVTR